MFNTVVIVTTFSCVERFLGFLYRIFLSRTLGAEGLGLYQISLSVLGLFMTVTSSGIPITVSRLMIKHKQEKKSQRAAATVSAGILTAIATSIPLTLLAFSKSGILNALFSDERCIPIFAIMVPGLIFTSVYAVIRGTFWANQQFLTYSIIEFLEESVMLIAGIILVNCAVDITKGVHMAGYAVLISYLFSFTVSIAVFFIRGGKLSLPFGEFSPLIKSSAPITAMRTSTSFINTLVAVILPARLVYYGITSSDAVALFGKVFGMAFPLIFMPSTLIGSIALVLTPKISENYYSRQFYTLKSNAEKSLKFSCLIACIIIPVFLCLGQEIGSFIYSDSSVGVYVAKGAVIMLPLSISIISTSLLNSLNKERQTLLSFFAGASVMIICIYFLPPILGIDCLILGMLLNYTVTAIINVLMLYKQIPAKLNVIKYFALSALSVVPSAIFGLLLKNVLAKRLGTFLIIAVCSASVVLFTALVMLLLGLLTFIFEATEPHIREKSKLKAFKKRNSFNNWN